MIAAVSGIALIYWHFPVLLVVISLVYSAARYETWPAILREACRWGARMAFFLFVVGAVLYLLGLFIS
jgi:hypothetical protein